MPRETKAMESKPERVLSPVGGVTSIGMLLSSESFEVTGSIPPDFLGMLFLRLSDIEEVSEDLSLFFEECFLSGLLLSELLWSELSFSVSEESSEKPLFCELVAVVAEET